MIIVTKEPDRFAECKVCKSLLSYNWKEDVKKRDVEGSMFSLPSTLYYIKCPICKHQVVILKHYEAIMKTYLIMNVHTHNYEIINHALGYEVKEVALPMARPRNNVDNYEIVITKINGMVSKYPYSSYTIFEQVEPRDEPYPN